VESLFRSRFGAIIEEDPDVPKSIAAKTPIVLLNPNSKFSRTLRSFSSVLLRDRDHRFDMAKQPQRKVPEPEAEAYEQSGFLGWLSGIIRRVFRR